MTGGVHEHMRAWEPEEDQTIIRLLGELGPKWSRIVQQLPGRSVSSVRNRWQRIEKGRKLREAGHESKNRCQRCGHPKRGHVCTAKLKGRGDSPAPGSVPGPVAKVPQVRRIPAAPPLNPPRAADTGTSARAGSAGGMPPTQRGGSNGYEGAVYGGAYCSFSAEAAAASSAFEPALGRMKSEGRICSDLGFEVRRRPPSHSWTFAAPTHPPRRIPP